MSVIQCISNVFFLIYSTHKQRISVGQCNAVFRWRVCNRWNTSSLQAADINSAQQELCVLIRFFISTFIANARRKLVEVNILYFISCKGMLKQKAKCNFLYLKDLCTFWSQYLKTKKYFSSHTKISPTQVRCEFDYKTNDISNAICELFKTCHAQSLFIVLFISASFWISTSIISPRYRSTSKFIQLMACDKR